MKLLENKVVIITGASKGIGKGMALKFAENGANVAFTYLSSEEKAKEVENELAALGIKAKGYKSDASDFEQATKLVEEVAKEFGEVIVVAPDKPQSAQGHAITIREPLRLKKVNVFYKATMSLPARHAIILM